MPAIFLYPLLAGGGFGLGFWSADGFNSLIKIALLLAVAYFLYRWGLLDGFLN
ncbi:hypothetical protein [Thalassotalea euphylliae]|uniref:hypothetical protein n=1 Tax=Thalassotalea euphylliae TaxID=1655234 RepID=UPI0015F25CE9|nr:hypothetical protein [Thalassotalea euphylliae]